jgi:hypothetical protein
MFRFMSVQLLWFNTDTVMVMWNYLHFANQTNSIYLPVLVLKNESDAISGYISTINTRYVYIYIYMYKSKADPLQAWTGPEGE